MPLYEFKCSCGAVLAEYRPFSQATDPVRCACGREARRIFSAPRVQNLSASRDTLRSWGRDLRVDRNVMGLGQLIREREAARRDPERAGRAAEKEVT